MTIKEIKHGNAKREINKRGNRKRRKQPFPKIYTNEQEDYYLQGGIEDQITAIMVDRGSSSHLAEK
ncbi:hypothetical protein [Dyadobacter bucti]|uniref:hypothetical protein n=1 Tax=Dyadobacter bucti TaxID=2572203 RepID=UPI001108BD2E|nr:hypothetical protein [Dyadobacter bucti]